MWGVKKINVLCFTEAGLGCFCDSPALGRYLRCFLKKRLGNGLVCLALHILIWAQIPFVIPIVFPEKAAAQDAPPDIPDPSKLENQFDDVDMPQSTISITPPDRIKQQPPPDSNVRFQLSKVTINGAQALAPDALTPLYAPFLGQSISLSQVYELAGQMTALYRNNGFILSRVVVPAQEIEHGQITLQVVEGYIDTVSIEGNIKLGHKVLTRLGDRIRASVPLTASALERYMLLANDLPGIQAQAVLQPSPTSPGATNLTILVSEDPVFFYGTVNNRGSKFNGPIQMQLGASFNSLFTAASKTSVRLIGASQLAEFKSGEIRHEQVLGSEGTTMTLLARHTRSQPGASLADLEIRSRSTSGAFIVSHPVIRSRAKSLYVHAGLDIRNTETTILGEDFTKDRVRKVTTGASFDFIDSLDGVNLVSTELHHGLDILGAKDTGSTGMSRADAQTNFFKINFSAMRLQKITRRVNLLIDVTGQYTKDALAASEEMAIGGSQYGRAFDPSEISGDRGAAGRAELRYDAAANLNWLTRYQVYAFADYGVVWDHTDTGYISTDLGSTGAGLRLTLSRNISAQFELATPIKKTDDYDQRWGSALRGFFGLSLRF
ncbi:ShlB/FhaC/HecB family hemolysin secretion/activation protein [Kordiimonas sp.]|uniref:ShlB/FhaC/HecB family hemolysin secretion/activation protein n=1 Tax=Kordiimonas sp. TaxID=1970157 RepID=UPI003A944F37